MHNLTEESYKSPRLQRQVSICLGSITQSCLTWSPYLQSLPASPQPLSQQPCRGSLLPTLPNPNSSLQPSRPYQLIKSSFFLNYWLTLAFAGLFPSTPQNPISFVLPDLALAHVGSQVNIVNISLFPHFHQPQVKRVMAGLFFSQWK